jgi:hypothetical protein
LRNFAANHSEEHTKEIWIDFTPRTTKSSIGHYSPLHEAWAESATNLGLDWQVILGDQQEQKEKDLKFANLTTWPSHFSILDLFRLYSFFRLQGKGNRNILVYEGEFITFYLMLFIAKFSPKNTVIHFNWSNNNQLEQYSSKVFFTWHFNLINLFTRRNFKHYVENQPLRDKLNQRSRLDFSLFPTSTVFSPQKHLLNIENFSRIGLILNDKNLDQEKFNQIVSNIEKIFIGFEVKVFSYKRFRLESTTDNIYTMHFEQIDRDTYFSVINNAWINFFFYNEDNYKYLTSGRFLDALFVKSLIIVPIESHSLDWLGDRFGNMHRFNLYCSSSAEEIESLFDLEFHNSSLSFTPENTVRILQESGLCLRSQFKKEMSIYPRLTDLLLPFVFILLQLKFCLLLTKRILHNLKVRLLGRA